jgi:hypothetical protein
MSPRAYIYYEDDGLLRAYPGEAEHEEPCFTWTYSTFERYLNEYLTPSMYHFMAGYVGKHLAKEDLWDLAARDYSAGDLEAAAIDAYFDTPLADRIEMHEQELVNLRAELRRARDKESAAIDAMLEEHKPFDHTSPIDREYCNCMRSIIDKAQADIMRLETAIYEEEQWRGGYEVGAELEAREGGYDPMEE